MPDKSTSQRDRLGMTEYCGQVSLIKSGSLLFDEPLLLSQETSIITTRKGKTIAESNIWLLFLILLQMNIEKID